MTHRSNPIAAFITACWRELVAAVMDSLVFWVVLALCSLVAGVLIVYIVDYESSPAM